MRQPRRPDRQGVKGLRPFPLAPGLGVSLRVGGFIGAPVSVDRWHVRDREIGIPFDLGVAILGSETGATCRTS